MMTRAFQESLIVILCFSAEHGQTVLDRIPIHSYESFYRKLAEKAHAFWDAHKTPPGEHTLDIVDDLILENPKDENIYRRIYNSLIETKDGINADFVVNRAGEFVRQQRLKTAITEAIHFLKNPVINKESIEKVENILREWLDGGNDDQGIFHFQSVKELMGSNMETEYLIENILVARQPILLAGPVKSLKTSIMLDLALSLAGGRHFLNHFYVTRNVPVLVVSGESGLSVIKDTLLRISHKSKNWDGINLFISDQIPQLNNPKHLHAIKNKIIDCKAELLCIDPAYLALNGEDAANVMQFGKQIRDISQVCMDLNCALLLCHHSKKASGLDYQPIQLTDAAWAGFAEHCRQWLLVNHREKYDHETGVHRLWLNTGGSAGHGGLYALDVDEGTLAEGRKWIVNVTLASDAKINDTDRKRTDRVAQDKKQIIRAMTALEEQHPEGNSKSTIKVKTSLKNQFDAVLQSLIDDGIARECTYKRSNHIKLHQGYRLIKEDER